MTADGPKTNDTGGKSSRRLYYFGVLAFSVVLAAIGVAVLAVTLANGGGPASVGFVMGIAFLGVGVGRFWITLRTLR